MVYNVKEYNIFLQHCHQRKIGCFIAFSLINTINFLFLTNVTSLTD